MLPRTAALVCISVGAAAFGACSSSSRPASAHRTAVPRAVLQVASRTPFGTISVSGHGVVQGKPDTLTVSLGVSVIRPTASAAINDMESRAQALIDQLVASGVKKTDIQTTQLSVSPWYDSHQHLTGFNASNQVNADLHDMNRAGAVIDAASRAAGDAITMNGVTFSIQDSSALVRAARRLAVDTAANQGQQLATAARVRLGRVKSITETNQNAPTPQYYAGLDVAARQAASVPIEPGKQSLSIDVTIVYEIDQ